jgi:hypothetical protein
MKLLITIISLLCFSTTFSQWKRVEQLPSSEIASFFHKGDTLYAGGKKIIYVSKNNGLTWDSTSTIPQFILVTSIIVYKNELYAAAPRKGVFKSPDGGATWQDISAGIFVNIPEGIFPDVSDFCEFKGDLYATTFASSVYKLDPVNRNHWFSFNNGLSSLSEIAAAIVGTSNTLIAGTNRNGLYDYLPPNSTTWEERFLLPQVSVLEGAYDIITAHDTLFWAGRTGRFYMSTDNGLTWNLFGNRVSSGNSSPVNAKQALLTSAYFFTGTSFNTVFLYIKKDSLQNSFRDFSVVADHFTWKIDIVGDKLWDASDHGLFYMSLSDLPGISSADSISLSALPVRFTEFTTKCENRGVLLAWKTEQEQNSSHFEIEKSQDGIHWTVISRVPAAGNSNIEKSYSIIDNDPQNSFYRIAEYDVDGRAQYTSVRRSLCKSISTFSVWPNPVHDKIFITINNDNASSIIIKIIDSKGSLVKVQEVSASQGSNQFSVDMRSIAKGVYSLSIDSGDGLLRKTVQLVKQ